jgi:NADPH:quinone reductase-like Zn-dependent oxidoreductase
MGSDTRLSTLGSDTNGATTAEDTMQAIVQDTYGKLTPVIDKTYPLSEVPDAIRYQTSGQARGKIIITV